MGTATQARTRLAHRSETRVRTESGQSEHHRDDVHGLDTGQTRGDHEHRDVERHGGGRRRTARHSHHPRLAVDSR